MFRSRVRSRLLPSPERCPAVGQHRVPEKLLSPRLGTMAGSCHQAWEIGTAGTMLVPMLKLVPSPMLMPNLVPKPRRLPRSTQEGSCHAETFPGCANLEDGGRGEAGFGVSSPTDLSRPRCRPQLESYIQSSVKPEMAQLQQTAVQNQTATMLEIGSSLLNQSAEQTRKLTDVEAQVGGSGVGHSVLPPGLPQGQVLCAQGAAAGGWGPRCPPQSSPCSRAGAEPDVAHRDAAAGELAVHQQAGEAAAGADQRDPQAAEQEQVRVRGSGCSLGGLEPLQGSLGALRVAQPHHSPFGLGSSFTFTLPR